MTLSAGFWRRWEGRLYYWYYHVLPWPSAVRKRQWIVALHRHLPWLTRQTASYRMLPHVRHEDLRGIDIEAARRQMHDYATWRSAYVVLSGGERRRLRRIVGRLQPQPRLAVLVLTGAADAQAVTLASVRQQLYPPEQVVSGKSVALDPAVDFVVVLRAGVHMHEAALFHLAEAINQHPQGRLFYADEEWSDTGEPPFRPWFKPDWDPDLMLGYPLIGGLMACRRDDLEAFIPGFSAVSEGEDHALALQLSEALSDWEIVHVPRVLISARTPYPPLAGYPQQVEQALRRRAVSATVEPSALAAGTVRVRYPLPTPTPRVSLIIPTRNRLILLQRCLDTLITRTDYPDYEILVVDNGSDEADARAFLAGLGQRYPGVSIRVLRDERPFNYSRLNNQAVAQAGGELIGLLNNDLEIIHGDWLTEMVSQACQPGIGAVGARLLYPDGSLQHAGVIVGLGGAAGHVLRHAAADGPDGLGPPGLGRSRLVQRFSAVTAACLVVRKALYQDVGGLDEDTFPVSYNDVDFCLKLHQHGYRNLYTPFATLYHHESASRGSDDDDPVKAARAARELAALQQRWGTRDYRDPAYNPNFNRFGEDCGYSYPPES